MVVAIISSAQTQHRDEPTDAVSEAIAPLTRAVSDMDDEVSENNTNAERLVGVACQLAREEPLSAKTLKEDMVENSVAGVAFNLHALIAAALNYAGEGLEFKRRAQILQTLRTTDAPASMFFSATDGPTLVPNLLDLIHGRELSNV